MIGRVIHHGTQLARKSLRQWLRNNPGKRQLLRKSRCFSTAPESMSRGVAIGLFFGLTPTVGFQTMLAFPCCILLRGNFSLAFLSTWVTNPLTIPPAYYLFNQIGHWLYSESLVSVATAQKYPWLDAATAETLQFLLGGLAVATPVSLLAYVLMRWLTMRHHHKKHHSSLG